jgi:hypothetical protein
MDGHEGSAPSTPAWKTGVCLSTPMPDKIVGDEVTSLWLQPGSELDTNEIRVSLRRLLRIEMQSRAGMDFPSPASQMPKGDVRFAKCSAPASAALQVAACAARPTG